VQAGTITGTVNGLTGNIAIICVGDQAWWKLFTPDYTPADLASVNAPNPCTLFHPETGIASLVAATTDPVAKGQDPQRQGRGHQLRRQTSRRPDLRAAPPR
jgi:lipoprotein LprG